MRQHLIPSIVASVVAISATLGVAHFTKPLKMGDSGGAISVDTTGKLHQVRPETAARIAKTIWPELSQKQVDDLSALLAPKDSRRGKVTIFCIDDAKCGDLALNFDNAFSTAHWDSQMQNSGMIPPGILTSSVEMQTILSKVAPELNVHFDVSSNNAGPGEFIAIGARP